MNKKAKLEQAKIVIEKERNEILLRQHKDNLLVKREELKIKEEELKAKNRVDISLQEYENLKKENEELKKDNFRKQEAIDKFVEPFLANHVSPEILKKVVNGCFKLRFITTDDPAENVMRLTLVYDIPNGELL